MHCVLRIRERSDLIERERYEAKTAEADFGTSYDEIVRAPSAAAAFRMALACYSADRKITSICADFLVADAVLRNQSPAAVSLLTGKTTGNL
jgi:hypothetical protein